MSVLKNSVPPHQTILHLHHELQPAWAWMSLALQPEIGKRYKVLDK